MEFIRIGDKIISRQKLTSEIEKIFNMRIKGLSQQEVARKLSIDRTFISRLESLGEVRKGRRIAVIGFPIKNKSELLEMLEKEGVEFSLIMTEAERWDFVSESSGLHLFNKVMDLVTKLKRFDFIIVLASNKRIKLFKGIFDNEVIGIEIGQSPIEEDKLIDIKQIKTFINTLKIDGNTGVIR